MRSKADPITINPPCNVHRARHKLCGPLQLDVLARHTWCFRTRWDSTFGPPIRIIDGRQITRGQLPIPKSLLMGRIDKLYTPLDLPEGLVQAGG